VDDLFDEIAFELLSSGQVISRLMECGLQFGDVVKRIR
jgi:hypothetical protein